jgi:hypothetical protein
MYGLHGPRCVFLVRENFNCASLNVTIVGWAVSIVFVGL